MKKILVPALAFSICAGSTAVAEVSFPGKEPGKAKVECSESSASLSNKMFTASFRKAGSGVVFDGMKTADGKAVAQGGTNLFTITLADGKTYTSKELSSSSLEEIKLKADKKHPRLSEQLPGYAVGCTFKTPDKKLEIAWRAVLRNGSHYLRQEMEIKALKDTAFATLTPVTYNIVQGGTPELSGGTTHGKVVVNDLVFCGLETPMSQMSAPGGSAETSAEWDANKWSADIFSPVFNVPASMTSKYGKRYAEKDGPVVLGLMVAEGPVSFTKAGMCRIKASGDLNIVAIQLIPEGSESVACEDVHKASASATYTLDVPAAGTYTLKIWVDTKDADIEGSGTIAYTLPLKKAEEAASSGPASLVKGDWERRTTLKAGQSWKVSSVLGFFAPKQERRSFLAYLERERAVPYRLFIHYNDWYELGITLNNNEDPLQRNTEQKQLELLEVWKREMIQKRKTPIDCFVIDDGWDDFNSLWNFHAGFPNGFSKIDKMLRSMKSGLGTWLGPVGGYGHSKALRLGNWNKNHPDNQIGNFQLSNKEYFDAFVGRCSQMVRDYEMRYFKFDGISAQFHAKGPSGLEDAEGIISVLSELRKVRKDLFINTTVGTWSSPFWLHYSDSLWRQENDFQEHGPAAGDPRDKWMTYRDRLVYEAFVKRSPLYPINSVMTHGIIITKNGPPRVMSKEPENCLKEIRSHVGCGTCLQELYVDRDLLIQEDGRLWNELADGIKWLRRNEDVLADIHWVGGHPWDDSVGDGCVYGWAAWSPTKCTLTLRNSSASEKTLTGTLREILDVPPSVKKDKVKFRSSFKGQRNISALLSGAIDIDKKLTITLQPQEVIVLEGVCAGGKKKAEASEEEADDEDEDDDEPRKKKKSKKKSKKKKKAK